MRWRDEKRSLRSQILVVWGGTYLAAKAATEEEVLEGEDGRSVTPNPIPGRILHA